LEALRLVLPFQRVQVWGRNADRARKYAVEMSAALGMPVAIAENPCLAIKNAQVVVTTTASRSPLITAADLHPGMLITAIGSDGEGKQELAADVLLRADRIICDSRAQCERLGELQHVTDLASLAPKIAELGAVVSGMARGRSHDDEVTICDLTGVGVQDTAIADYVYKQLR
jgi:ornithine cyclodeaminase/alanine dehydrogenase-like protein (mu-crystallin family)